MKKLTLALVVALFASCSNQKVKIVEQIKSYKDSSLAVTKEISILLVNETLKYEELYFTNGKKDYDKVGNADIRKQYDDYHAKKEAKEWDLKLKQIHFESKIDSLELELKKY
jgi:hypothetical protein